MKTLTLANNLKLPADEAATQKYGFIGRSGSGKSYAAMKLAELLLGAGTQVIVLDWVGIWWSLRLAKDGRHPGFEHVYIFGGEHADVPLEPTSGALMADLIVDKHISAVLDVMHFRKAERTRFATAFAEQFFHRKKTARTACHLFIEEAQAYLPQMVRGDEARMVGVFEDIGKVGRNYGIGNSLISQRPQAINKDVLNQVEVLLAFQTNGPQERKTIAGWTAENTTAGAAMIAELPTLPRGDALVWSPQWLRVAQRVHISERDTYDASSTPISNAKAIAPKTLAKSDLEALGTEIKATIEKAKADDPRELKKQLASARAELATAQALTAKASAGGNNSGIIRAEKAALTDADRELLRKVETKLVLIDVKAGEIAGAAEQRASRLVEGVLAEYLDTTRSVGVEAARRVAELLEAASVKKLIEKLNGLSVTPLCPTAPPRGHTQSTAARRSPSPAPSRAPVATRAPSDGALAPAKQKILNALAFLAGSGVTPADKTQLALIVGVSPTSGGYFNNLGALRSSGFIEYPQGGTVALTQDGAALASTDGIPSTTEDLHVAIRAKLPPAKWKILEALIGVYPDALAKDALAEVIGVSPTSGGYFNNLGSLRSLGLIAYPRPSEVAALPVLFLEG